MKKLKLSKLDWKLLQLLDKNPQETVSSLAKKCITSKERIHYRIKRLEEHDVITGYWALMRIPAHASAYKLLIKDRSLGAKTKEFIQHIIQMPQAGWIAHTQGAWDYIISIYGPDYEATTCIQEILTHYGTYFSEKMIIKATHATSINERYVHDNAYVTTHTDTFGSIHRQYDELETHIINKLAQNARSTYTEIAQGTDKSIETIRKKTKELIEKKTFTDIKLRINHEALGLKYAHIMISLRKYDKKEALRMHAIQQKEVVFIMEHLGHYDLHLEVVYENSLEQLRNNITELFGEAIQRFDVVEILKEHRIYLHL